MAKATAKAKMVNIEVLFDGEISTGLESAAHQFLPEGAVIQASEDAAKSLAAGRSAKIVTKKVSVDLSADPDTIIAAIEKIEEANEAARAELDGEE